MIVVLVLVAFAPMWVSLIFWGWLGWNYWFERGVVEKGRVYMHRRHAMMWSVTATMNAALILTAILQSALVGVPWWSTGGIAVLVGVALVFALHQRQVQLGRMRAAEDEEIKRVRIPDYPEQP